MNESNKPITAITKLATLPTSQVSALPPNAAPQAEDLASKPQTNPVLAGQRKVRFELSAANASMVSVAGTFHDWKPGATPLSFLGGTKWARKLFLAPGHYEYRFVVNGQWVEPPHAKDYVPNPFGGRNAVVEI